MRSAPCSGTSMSTSASRSPMRAPPASSRHVEVRRDADMHILLLVALSLPTWVLAPIEPRPCGLLSPTTRKAALVPPLLTAACPNWPAATTTHGHVDTGRHRHDIVRAPNRHKSRVHELL